MKKVPIDDGGQQNGYDKPSSGDAVPVNYSKSYIGDEPITYDGLINTLEDLYGEHGVTVTNDSSGRQMIRIMGGGAQETRAGGKPQLTHDDGTNPYPTSLSAVLESADADLAPRARGVEFSINQSNYLPIEAEVGMEVDAEEFEKYTIQLNAQGSKQETEKLFQAIEDEYGEMLDDINAAEQIAKQKRLQQERENELTADMMGRMGQGQEQGQASKYEPLEKEKLAEYSWDDVALPDDVKDSVKTYVEGPMQNPELFDYANIDPKGIILSGEAGVGKTLLAKVVASEADSNFYSANISELKSKWVGESEGNVKAMFEEAKENAPSVVFLDEIDSLLAERGDGDTAGHEVKNDMVNTFLNEMDGVEELEDVLVIGATNRPKALDKAAIRNQRFNEVIDVPKPNEEARGEIFKIHLDDYDDRVGDIDYDELAQETEGFTGADIAGAVEQASKEKVSELKEEYGDFASIPAEEFTLEQDDLYETVKDVKENDARVKDPEEDDGIGFRTAQRQ